MACEEEDRCMSCEEEDTCMSCEEEDTCLEQRVDIGLEVAAYPRVTLEDTVGIKSYLPVIVHVSNT